MISWLIPHQPLCPKSQHCASCSLGSSGKSPSHFCLGHPALPTDLTNAPQAFPYIWRCISGSNSSVWSKILYKVLLKVRQSNPSLDNSKMHSFMLKSSYSNTNICGRQKLNSVYKKNLLVWFRYKLWYSYFDFGILKCYKKFRTTLIKFVLASLTFVPLLRERKELFWITV